MMMLSRSLRMKTKATHARTIKKPFNPFTCAATTTPQAEVASSATEKMFTDEQYAEAIAKAAAEIKAQKLEMTTTTEEGSDVTATPKTRVFTDEQYEAAIAAAVALKEQQMAVQEATTAVETTTDAAATNPELAGDVASAKQVMFTEEQYAAALAAATDPALAAASAPKPVPVTEAMAFSGPAPETINGRLAMVGFVSAVAAEFSKQETIVQQ